MNFYIFVNKSCDSESEPASYNSKCGMMRNEAQVDQVLEKKGGWVRKRNLIGFQLRRRVTCPARASPKRFVRRS